MWIRGRQLISLRSIHGLNAEAIAFILVWGHEVESPSIRRWRVAKAITGDLAGDLLLGWVGFHVKVGCRMFLEFKFFRWNLAAFLGYNVFNLYCFHLGSNQIAPESRAETGEMKTTKFLQEIGSFFNWLFKFALISLARFMTLACKDKADSASFSTCLGHLSKGDGISDPTIVTR